MSQEKSWVRRVIYFVSGGLFLVGVFIGGQKLGSALSVGDSSATAIEAIGVTSTSTTANPSTMSTETLVTTSTTTHSIADVTVPPSSGGTTDGSDPESGPTVLTLGDPTVAPTPPVDRSDRVQILPGVVPDGLELTSVSQRGESRLEAPLSQSRLAGPERGFGVGVDVETDGHYATFIVGVSSGPNGLAGLTVHFGDGSDPYVMSQSDIERLGSIGTVEVIHRFEPSVAPRQWHFVQVEATDGLGDVRIARPVTVVDGQDRQLIVTQGKFNVIYSPLRILALEDCDLFGTSEYRLSWNNDGRDRSAEFTLDKGETHVEESFRVRIGGVTSGNEPPLFLNVTEMDSSVAKALKVLTLQVSFNEMFLTETEKILSVVLEEGSHSYPVSLSLDAGSRCDARATFSVTISSDESVGQ